MDVSQAIKERRAYRSLDPVEITEDLVKDLAGSAILAPSCFNNQPTRFVFVYDPEVLMKMREALSQGNQWAQAASMIIAVFSKKEDDCMIKDREYHQFDCGLASGLLILRATELGLVAHPIAGYSPKKTREVLGIPEEYQVITLIIVGKHSAEISPVLSGEQVGWEKERPQRLPLEKFAFFNHYGGKTG
ncbi:MAG: nitroreductase family protein [Candidatus Aminicenantes bacterium]|nr:nitroreductase family protein [Candidatus Aminicenantes bacterium]MDH5466307.1 nitroreductase family protein [Candidatus Aminicenantes bacterium]MDH5706865.1 nitroreductase family protein [Candidatus Aminicenantes bacterium]